MILTITLNPAVDRTIVVETFEIDKVNRVSQLRRDIGGKGLNVTKTIRAMGGSSKALLVLGGENGKYILEKSISEGLNIESFEIDGDTRENIKIVDPIHGTFTDVNEPGPVLSNHQKAGLIERIQNNLELNDWLVISGSSPSGIDEEFYQSIFEDAKLKNVKIIADVNGKQLSNILKFKPYLIKPNIDELADLFEEKITSKTQAIAYARKVIEQGVEVVVVSLGSEGLLWVTKETALFANALKVDVKSTVGAGDAIVAGLTWSLSQNLLAEDVMKNAVAAATCVITTEGTNTGEMEMFKTYRDLVFITSL